MWSLVPRPTGDCTLLLHWHQAAIESRAAILVKLIRAYVTGLACAPEIGIPPTIVEQHLDSFHHPNNLLLASIILITSREDSVKDLLALVHLRPWDPSWAICLQNIRQAMLWDPHAEREWRDTFLENKTRE
ncbi:hypothetical protein EDD85DRAFT_798852 [Armillaria nabsnona]|nr:hypothetical protein EDD85DRAFT_798852 [Armillaria nabsnona]